VTTLTVRDVILRLAELEARVEPMKRRKGPPWRPLPYRTGPGARRGRVRAGPAAGPPRSAYAKAGGEVDLFSFALSLRRGSVVVC
jgi:hypothetical protein